MKKFNLILFFLFLLVFTIFLFIAPNFVSGATNVTLRPNGNATYTNFSVSPAGLQNWQSVDEVTENQTDYVQNNTASTSELYNLTDTSISSSNFTNVTVFVRAKRVSAGSNVFKLMIRSGTTNALSTDISTTNTVTTYSYSWSTNPATSAIWNQTTINSLEAGMQTNTTNYGVIIYQLWTDVEYNGCNNGTYVYGCGQTILQSCNLTGNMDCTGNGLVAGADTIKINGKGYNITGDGGASDYGVTFSGSRSGINVTNLTIKNFGHGIEDYETSGVFSNVDILSCTYGIYINQRDSNKFYNITIDNSSQYGIYIDGSDSNIIFATNISNSGRGIYIADTAMFVDSLSNNISNTRIYNCTSASSDGIYLGSTEVNKTIVNNVNVTNCYYGIRVKGSHNRITNSIFSEAMEAGIAFTQNSGFNNSCVNCILKNNYKGVSVTSTATSNNVTDSEIFSNMYGYYLTSGSGIMHRNNLTANNIPFYITSGTQTFTNNSISHSVQPRIFNSSLLNESIERRYAISTPLSNTFYVYYPNGTATSSYTYNITVYPTIIEDGEPYSNQTNGNNFTVNLSTAREGIYTLSINVSLTDINVWEVHNYIFLFGNPWSQKFRMYLHSEQPRYGQPKAMAGYDSGSALFSQTPAEEERHCGQWVQYTPMEQLTQYFIIKNISNGFYYNSSSGTTSLIQIYVNYTNIGEYSKTIPVGSSWTFNITNFTNLNITSDYAYRFFWTASKLNDGDVMIKSNETYQSWVDYTYIGTGANITQLTTDNNTDIRNVRLLSSYFFIANDTRFEFDGIGNVTLAVTGLNSTTYNISLNGAVCPTTNCIVNTNTGGNVNVTVYFTSYSIVRFENSSGGDSTNPIASFGTNPIDYFNSSSQSITFDAKCSDDIGVSEIQLWSNWSGTWKTNYTNSSYTNDTWLNISVTGIPEGRNHKWAVWCNDSSGNPDWTDTNRTFAVDMMSPSISGNQVNDTEVFIGEAICINADIVDAGVGVDKAWVSITYPDETILNYSAITLMEDKGGTSCDGGNGDNNYGVEINVGAIEGIFYVNATYANDTVGNLGSDSTVWEISVLSPDSTNPTASFGTNPIDNYNDSDGSITFDMKCSDNIAVSHLQLWGNWSGTWAINQTNSSPINDTIWSVTVTGISDGNWKWGVWCNDTSSLDDWSDTNRTFKVETGTDVTFCRNLTTANSIYTLLNNVSSSGTCFNITNSNITLDCNGYSINYSTGGGTAFFGVISDYTSNITIRDCIIYDGIGTSSDGIRLNYVNDSLVNNNTFLIYNNLNGGILLDDNLRTNVTNNTISGFGTSEDGILIYTASFNNTISYNQINNFSRWGIYSNDDNNTINYNNLTTERNNTKGIYIFSSVEFMNITGNRINIGNETGYGIVLDTSARYSTLNNNIINMTSSSGAGVYITTNSHRNNFTNLVINADSGANGMFIENSQNTTIFNSLISSSVADIRLGVAGTSNFTNVTFSKSDTSFDGGATSIINVKWYMDVYINDSGGSPIDSANVTSTDTNANLINWSSTNSSGYISRLVLKEYRQNATDYYFDTNYTVNASKTGYNTNTTQVNLTNNFVDSNKIFLTLIAIGADNPPYWSNNVTSIPATYSPTTQSYFNITWQDDNGVNSSWFESNYSSSPYNYSMNHLGSNVYNYSAILPVGTYYWKSYANDTIGQWNSTDTWVFTISQNTNACDVLFNETSPKTYPYAFKVYSNCDSDFSLYRNGTSVSNNSIQSLSVGYWNFTVQRTDTQNYTNVADTEFFTINQATGICYLSFNPSSPITYGTQLNASCYCTNPESSYTLYRNSTNITSENNQFITLGAGNWNYTCNVSSNQNYSSATNSSSYTVNQATTSISLLINDSANNWTSTYPNSTYKVNATSNVSGAIVTLYRNDTQINQGTTSVQNITTYPATIYYFKANTTGNDNYSSSQSSIYWITISKGTPILSLVANPSWTNTYPTETNVSGSNCSTQLTCNFYRDSVSKTNPEILTLGYGIYNYTYNTTGNENYSAYSNSSNLTINKNTGACSVLFNETSPKTYPYTFKVYSDCNSVATLYRNGTTISNNSAQTLSVGYWNFTVQRTDTQNYTNVADTEYFTIDQATSTCSLKFDKTSPQDYGTQLNASCYCTNPESSYTLYRNNINVTNTENNQLITLPANTHNYVCNVSAIENYSSATNSSSFTISRVSPNLHLYLNGTEGNRNYQIPATVNATATKSTGTEGTLELLKNGTVIQTTTGNSLTNLTNYLAIDYINYTTRFNQTENYSAQGVIYFVTLTEDNEPSVTLNYPIDTYNTTSSSITFNCSAYDDRNLTNVSLYGNWSGGWHLNTTNSSPVNNTNIIFSKTISDGYYRWNCYACDNSSQCSFATSNRTFKIDSTPPAWSNNQSSTPPTYSATYSTFNITWIDSLNTVNVTYIESNFSGSPNNYSMVSLGSNNYGYSIILPAETYYWKSYANDSFSNMNVSNTWIFTIAKSSSGCDVLFNETSPKTYPYAFKVYSNCDSDFSLYRNGTSVSNNSIQSLSVGYWNFTVQRTDTQNYTNVADTEYFTISQNTGGCGVYFNETSPLTYPAQFKAYSNCNSNFNLYRNGTSISNNSVQSLGVGYWNFTVQRVDIENYSNIVDTQYFTISKASINVNLYLNNNLNQNVTITYGTSSNATGVSSAGTINLFRDNVAVSNPEIVTLTANPSGYAYKVNATGNENYSDNDTGRTYYLKINKASSSINLYLNGTSGNKDYTQYETANFTCDLETPASGYVYLWTNYSDGTMKIWDEGNDVLINYTVLNEYGYYLWKCNWSGNDNYSSDSETHYTNISEYIAPDLTNPLVEFGTNPIDYYNSTSNSITFDLKCSDNVAVSSLQIWGNWSGSWSAKATNSSPINDTWWNKTIAIANGYYKWAGYCLDSSGNPDWTDTNRTLNISAAVVSGGNITVRRCENKPYVTIR